VIKKNPETSNASKGMTLPEGIGLCGELILSMSLSKKSFIDNIAAVAVIIAQHARRISILFKNKVNANAAPVNILNSAAK
jgi:hypothetical protein